MNQGRVFFCIVCILMVLIPGRVLLAEESLGRESGNGKNLVEVEPTYYHSKPENGTYTLLPYRQRRPNWGWHFGVSYSPFLPVNYQPDGFGNSFKEVYGSKESPLIEVQWNIKRNFSWGALGMEWGLGNYSNTSQGSFSGSDLVLQPLRAGFQYTLDTLFPEPWVAPFASLGGLIVIYEESYGGTEFGGSTQLSGYGSAGLLFQLDWLDSHSARVAFEESGVQNSFIMVKAQYFMASQAAQDPDFSTLYYSAGLQLEF